jgi:hypothetical protein
MSLPSTGGQGGTGVSMPPLTGAGAGGTPVTGGMGAGTGGTPATGNGAMFDAGTDPARNMVQAGAVCARLAQIQCAGEAYCCANPGRDRASCEAAQTSSCAGKAYIDLISTSPAAGFDPAHAAAAFTELERLASQCDPSIGTYAATTQGLVGIFKGTTGPGGGCGPGGSVFDPPSKEQAAVALASCSSIETSACMPPSDTSLDWKCSPKAGAGAECLTDLNCQAGLYCLNPKLAAGDFGLGSCNARKAPGSPCAAGNECTTFYCVAGACGMAEAQAAYCLAQQR